MCYGSFTLYSIYDTHVTCCIVEAVVWSHQQTVRSIQLSISWLLFCRSAVQTAYSLTAATFRGSRGAKIEGLLHQAWGGMNPAQYKQAMRQRALDRQAERDNLQLLETQHLCRDRSVQLSISAPRDSLATTHTPRRSSDIVRGGKALLSRFDSEGDMAGAPASKASSAKQSAFGLDELHHQKQVRSTNGQDEVL